MLVGGLRRRLCKTLLRKNGALQDCLIVPWNCKYFLALLSSPSGWGKYLIGLMSGAAEGVRGLGDWPGFSWRPESVGLLFKSSNHFRKNWCHAVDRNTPHFSNFKSLEIATQFCLPYITDEICSITHYNTFLFLVGISTFSLYWRNLSKWPIWLLSLWKHNFKEIWEMYSQGCKRSIYNLSHEVFTYSFIYLTNIY